MWVLIDNYDSFTHILHHYLLETGADCKVIRNDAATVAELAALNPSRLILSPGPGRPANAGIMMEALQYFHDKIPVLGICLGHQAIGEFFGATLHHAPAPVHGKVRLARHSGDALFKNVPHDFEVMRYHSLSILLPQKSVLEPIAFCPADEVVMAVRHRSLPITGIQFHPESIGTTAGKIIIRNWADS